MLLDGNMSLIYFRGDSLIGRLFGGSDRISAAFKRFIAGTVWQKSVPICSRTQLHASTRYTGYFKSHWTPAFIYATTTEKTKCRLTTVFGDISTFVAQWLKILA